MMPVEYLIRYGVHYPGRTPAATVHCHAGNILTDGSKLLVDHAGPRGHLVQLYEVGETTLVDNVVGYFAEGLKRRQGAVIVATPSHREAFFDALKRSGINVDQALAREQLVASDAGTLLARFMIDGTPNAELFDKAVGTFVREASGRSEGRGLRVYGEMVGELWKTRQYQAAVALENLWNKLAESIEFHLYCSYPIDLFDEHLDIGALDDVLCTHSQLVPARSDDRLEAAIAKAMGTVLGADAKSIRPLAVDRGRHTWAAMPRGQATIFWLRDNLPHKQAEILSLARQYYRSTR